MADTKCKTKMMTAAGTEIAIRVPVETHRGDEVEISRRVAKRLEGQNYFGGKSIVLCVPGTRSADDRYFTRVA